MPLLEAVSRVNAIKEVRTQQTFLLVLEAKCQKEIEKIFKLQGNLALTALRDDHIDQGALDKALDLAFLHTDNQLIQILVKYNIVASYFGIRSQAKQLGMVIPTPEIREAAASIGISFDAVDHEAYKWIQDTAAKTVSGVDNTTRDRIRDILAKGTEDKLSYSAIAQNIRDEFKDMATPASQSYVKDRAEVIAVTEVRKAHEYSQKLVRDGLKKQGWKIKKSWMITNDEKCCDICQGNADAGWIDDDDVFPSGDEYPPAHPVCRCCSLTRNDGYEGTDEEEEPEVIQVAPSTYTVSSPAQQNIVSSPMIAVMGIGSFIKWVLPNVSEKPKPISTPSVDIGSGDNHSRSGSFELRKKRRKIPPFF